MPAHLHVGLVDMNNGVPNEAIRCFRRLLTGFILRVEHRNPGLEVVIHHVQPRNLGEVPPAHCDLVLSTGGPGSPFDGYEEPWCTSYRRFLDAVVDANLSGRVTPAVLVVCHSFELAIQHFAFARMERRASKKFGLMPVYMTPDGMRAPLLESFGDRLFAWEHRDWEAIDLDPKRLAEVGGELWAVETRPHGASTWKGDGLLAFKFAPGIEGTQFHPEADREGALAWIRRPEQAAATIAAYGETTYQRMLSSVDDPTRLGRTFDTVIPGWMDRAFDAVARLRDLHPIALTPAPGEPTIAIP